MQRILTSRIDCYALRDGRTTQSLDLRQRTQMLCHIQRYAKFDLMRPGNPQLEELVIATMGAVAVILVARIVAKPVT